MTNIEALALSKPSQNASYLGRREAEFWTHSEQHVVRCSGFSCDDIGEMWWLPSAGFSTSCGNLFKTKSEAAKWALAECERMIERLEDRADTLRQLV